MSKAQLQENLQCICMNVIVPWLVLGVGPCAFEADQTDHTSQNVLLNNVQKLHDAAPDWLISLPDAFQWARRAAHELMLQLEPQISKNSIWVGALNAAVPYKHQTITSSTGNTEKGIHLCKLLQCANCLALNLRGRV